MTNQEQYEILQEKAKKYDELITNEKIVEQAILNHAILNTLKICKDKKDISCDGCILSIYDCPFPDLNYNLEKGRE